MALKSVPKANRSTIQATHHPTGGDPSADSNSSPADPEAPADFATVPQ